MEITQLYIFNMSEDVLEYITTVMNPDDKAYELRENTLFADREYLALRSEHPGDFVYISPISLDEDFLAYADELIGKPRGTILYTQHHSGSTCDDALAEGLIEAINGVGDNHISVQSYCASPQLYRFAEVLEQRGVLVSFEEAPATKANLDQILTPGTKVGIRQLINQHPELDIHMAPGTIGKGMSWVMQEASRRFEAEGAVVVKTNKGHAGLGVEIFPPSPSFTLEDLHSRLDANIQCWELYPSVVESFIRTDTTIAGGFPGIEGYINADGSVNLPYICGNRTTTSGVFEGVEVSHQILPMTMMGEIRRVALALGRQFALGGYRGYFDVDCMAGVDGTLYVSEVNLRRNGGTYAHILARGLLGNSYLEDGYFVVAQLIHLKTTQLTFSRLLGLLSDLLYSKERKEGIVVVSSAFLRMGRLSFLIIGSTRERTQTLEKALRLRIDSM